MLKILAAFGAMVALDFAWAKYTIYCADRRPAHAAAIASIIFGLGAYVTLTYVDDPWMLLPATAGALVGTYLAVRQA